MDIRTVTDAIRYVGVDDNTLAPVSYTHLKKRLMDREGRLGAESWRRSSLPFSTISPSQYRSPWNVCRTRWSGRSWSADTMRLSLIHIWLKRAGWIGRSSNR